mmetsp:Transcript_15839/g.25873  ORF Transcript_15839/g.25873 Transcript_15839/m.25873 type:complete len:119 (-) Transcript_15839:361-717(-)
MGTSKIQKITIVKRHGAPRNSNGGDNDIDNMIHTTHKNWVDLKEGSYKNDPARMRTIRKFSVYIAEKQGLDSGELWEYFQPTVEDQRITDALRDLATMWMSGIVQEMKTKKLATTYVK